MNHKKQIIALFVFTLLSSLSINNAFAGYLIDAHGKVVIDGYKECWQAKWADSTMSETCGDKKPVMETRAIEPVVAVSQDSDGDGVNDDLDRCPNSKTSDVDEYGCARDSDGDGVADYLDNCSSTASGVKVDDIGCALDSDDDGVVNGVDNCPSTPAGKKVDAKGCQIIENMTLQSGVNSFEVNSATLKPEMMNILDGIADKILASTGKETITVIGHTDQYGTESYNQSLSEKRAKAVADYLAAQGIDKASISSSGMGETSPIASNSTREGRAKNRRVEIQTK